MAAILRFPSFPRSNISPLTRYFPRALKLDERDPRDAHELLPRQLMSLINNPIAPGTIHSHSFLLPQRLFGWQTRQSLITRKRFSFNFLIPFSTFPKPRIDDVSPIVPLLSANFLFLFFPFFFGTYYSL